PPNLHSFPTRRSSDLEGRLDAHAARMANPDRLVLDFAGTRLAVQRTMIPGVAAPVRGVRLGQFRPDTVRVVIDLSETTPYQISRDRKSTRLNSSHVAI